MPTFNWPRRYNVVLLSTLAVFVCYIDRVNISVAIIPMAADLDWGMQTQGMVLSSFFVGYLLLQIVGGLLADRFGGKVVLGVGVLLWSLFTILTPPAASIGLGLLLATRILMGMGEAVTFPSIYSLYSRWVPITERSRAVGLANSGIPLGTIFALIVTPMIVQAWGWQWAFYLFGLVGFAWFVFWQVLIARSPEADERMTEAEREFIKAGANSDPVESGPPLREFLKSMPVWAIIVAHFCNNWSLYVLLSWLPTFINKGLGVDYASVGWVTMIPHVASFIFLNVAGNIADRLVRSGMDVGKVRKLMQTIGFGGISTALLIVGEVESVWLAITIMTIGNALGAFVVGGFVVNHMDIAPKYAGTLMGITNTAGTIPGIIGVFVSGLILELTGSWALVFQVTAGVTLFGLVFFLMFSSSKKLFD
ncbi:ACS family MFS transporter [Pseudomonadales bacterium]|nr:ACS family MFS transporter [Pseudomonadales bacterium]MDB9879874.1 ACS family MFS transporter [Pseudomonadales bacterium]MDC0013550.1 ACS family MFS transporter [Pseudomonadales bacterium]MDC0174373.1 ACS family MFS transporter [Pseudomonadales bacterium]MDC1306357.1 ACS family MFS transporter [Pseudomonadales bacterium]